MPGREGSRLRFACAALCVGLGIALPARGQAAAPPKAALAVGCSPDRPVARPGGEVALSVWVTDAAGKPLDRPPSIRWSASEGTISGGETARWQVDPAAPPPGKVRRLVAKAAVEVAGTGRTVCHTHLYVANPPRLRTRGTRRAPAGRVAARGLLLSAAAEPQGFGLYSYLLLGAPPKDESERERDLKAIGAYLAQLSPSEELQRYRQRGELNITLLPVKRDISPPDDATDPRQVAQAAEQLLAVYDFAHARHLLGSLGQDAGKRGPYLIARRPGAASAHFTFDMSNTAPQLVWDWVATFCSLTAQERSWSDEALTRLALNTRNFIAVTAGRVH